MKEETGKGRKAKNVLERSPPGENAKRSGKIAKPCRTFSKARSEIFSRKLRASFRRIGTENVDISRNSEIHRNRVRAIPKGRYPSY